MSDDAVARFEAAKRASLFQLLFRTARRVEERTLARINRAMAPHALRRAHTALFPHIDLEGTRPSEVARRLGVTRQAVGPLLDELEVMGVVERIPDPSDGRARLVRFVQGPDRLLDGVQGLLALEAELAAAWGRDEVDALRDLLAALDDRLDEGVLGAP